MSETSYQYTLQSYIKNPTGAGAASTPQRKAILDTLFAKYRVLLKMNHHFKTSAYRVSDSVVLHVRIPSESVEGVYYDVCIEFMNVANMETSMLTKNIKVFSNNFAFVYTYAYVMNQRGLLIDYLRSLLPKEVLSEPPKQRNPDETVNYEKSIVYAIYYIQEHRLFLRENYGPILHVSNKVSIKKEIREFEDVERDYANKKSLQSKKKEQEKKAAKAVRARELAKRKQTRKAATMAKSSPSKKR
jgi:hypothetical protein